MTENDKPDFVRIVLGLKAIKPGQPLTEEGIELFWQALRGCWELEDFRAAANHLARSCEFMPNPYHFEQLRQAQRMTAGEAWARARGSVGASGGYVQWTPTGDPVIDASIQAIGGAEQIFYCDADKLTFLERRFTEHYEQIRDVEETRAAIPQIAGPPRVRRVEGPQRAADWLKRLDS